MVQTKNNATQAGQWVGGTVGPLLAQRALNGRVCGAAGGMVGQGGATCASVEQSC